MQGAPHQRGVITATAFRHGVVENCEFAHIGEHAVSLLEGCADNTVRQCHIHDMGGGGVYLSEGKGAGKDESDMTVRTLVEDNFIHDGGHCFAAGCGVFLGGRASYNRILHNEVCDMSWMGVHAGWSWTGKAPTQTHHNEIAYNHLHHLGNGVLCDIGGIYTLGVSPGTVLHHNLIHDITRFERGKQGYGGWGIYLDAGSSEIRVENNVVYNTRDGGFHSHMDNWPYGCMLRNNVFAYSQTAQMMRNNKDEPEGLHLHIERNIIYNRNPKMYGGHNWNKDGHFTCERNCYWSEEGGELDFKGRSFAEWQSEGRDTDSIIADPRFVAPEKGDFRLRRKSPALVLGFQHIDLSDVGVRRPKALKRLTKNVTHRAYETAPPLPEPWPLHFDFEEYDAGEKPAGAIDEDGGARVTITDAVAGAGQQCMRFEDAPNVTDWKPHWYSYFKPRPDTLRMQCRFRNEPAEPATITFEFRDWPKGEPLRTGAYLKINPDGRAQAPDGADGWIDLGTCPPGEWITVDITLDQQADSAGTWAVQLTGPDGPIGSKTGLPCSNADFRRANWFGIVGADTKRALFHIDDVHLE